MNIWGLGLKLFGWRVNITAPKRDKCVICVAPHTSNFDFILGLAAYKSLGREANYLMKKFWFFFPLKYILKATGGIPVDRSSKSGHLTSQIIRKFETSTYINLAVTPEGTRNAQPKWRTGFLYIAYGAEVPIQLGVIDYKNKSIDINTEYIPVGDPEIDMQEIKKFYADKAPLAKIPSNFTT